MAPGKTAAAKKAEEKRAKGRAQSAKATATAAAGTPPPATPRTRSRRGDDAGDPQLAEVAAMNAANAKDERMREAEKKKGGRSATATAEADASVAAAAAAGAGAKTTAGGDGRGGAATGEAATRGADEGVTSPPARKRRAVHENDLVREALARAGAMPASPSVLRPPPLKHRDVLVTGQMDLSADKPSAQLMRAIQQLLVNMQKLAPGTRLEPVISGMTIEPISVPSNLPVGDLTLFQRYVDLNGAKLKRYVPFGRNKDTTPVNEDGTANPRPRFAIRISTSADPESLVGMVRPAFEDDVGVSLRVDKRHVLQAKSFAMAFKLHAKTLRGRLRRRRAGC